MLMCSCARKSRNEHSYIRLPLESNRKETGTCNVIVVLKRGMKVGIPDCTENKTLLVVYENPEHTFGSWRVVRDRCRVSSGAFSVVVFQHQPHSAFWSHTYLFQYL